MDIGPILSGRRFWQAIRTEQPTRPDPGYTSAT